MSELKNVADEILKQICGYYDECEIKRISKEGTLVVTYFNSDKEERINRYSADIEAVDYEQKKRLALVTIDYNESKNRICKGTFACEWVK